MNVQRRLAAVLTGFVWILSVSGCSTTDAALKPSQETFRQNGIGKGDTVIIHFRSPTNPNGSNRSETVRVTQVSPNGLEGVNDSGNRVIVKYDEIYRVHTSVSRKITATRVAATAADSVLAAGSGLMRIVEHLPCCPFTP